MSMIEKTIYNLRNTTSSYTNQLDVYNCPTKYDLMSEQQYEYLFDGQVVSFNDTVDLLLLVKNPPFYYGFTRYNFKESLVNLINNDEIRPFMLFINGNFVKWSNITVVKDYYYTYFIIKDAYYDIPNVDCVVLPDNITYNEGLEQARITDRTVFMFNYYGQLDKDGSSTTVTIDINDDIYVEKFNITKKHRLNLDTKYRINENNILIFKNKLYSTEKVDNKLLNIISTTNTDDKYCFAFSSFQESSVNDNISMIENKEYLANKYISNDYFGDNFSKFFERFDFVYDKNKSYDDNTLEFIKYIFSYNSNLMNLSYKYKNTIRSVYFTGKELKDKVSDDGYVSISRYLYHCIDNNIIVFKNGLLYEEYYKMYLENGKNFRFPLDTNLVLDDDQFEIMYFTQCNNTEYKIKLESYKDGNTHYLDPNIDISKAKLFSIDSKDREYNILHSEYIQYEVPFKGKRVSNNEVEIILEDGWYYDKDLSIVSGTDFRYVHFTAEKVDGGYQLPLDFKFANDINRYLIFINGRKIDHENFKVTIIKNTRPFIITSVYFNFLLEEGDSIDIFYVPSKLEEVVIQPEIELSNSVVIDKSKIKYGLDKDLYLIFLDGRKILPDQIVNVSNNRLIFRNNISINNLCIVKHIEDDEILGNLFSGNDLLSDIIDNLSENQYRSLFSFEEILPTDIGLARTQMENARVLYQIVRDFYDKPFICEDDIFTYDYYTDDDIVRDKDGNIIMNINNSN